MKENDIITKVESFLIKDRLEEALNLLSRFFQDQKENEYKDEALLLLGRLSYLTKGQNLGLIAELPLELNKIRKSIISLKNNASYILSAKENQSTFGGGNSAIASKGNSDVLSVIIDESFRNNNNNWSIGTKYLTDKVTVYGSIDIKSNRCIMTQLKDESMLGCWKAISLDISKDFIIETKATVREAVSNHGYGISWGANSEGDKFFFIVSTNGYYCIRYSLASLVTNIVDWKLSPHINIGTNTNVLRIHKRQNTVNYYINDHLVESRAFSELFGHWLGMVICDRKTVLFEYFKVLN